MDRFRVTQVGSNVGLKAALTYAEPDLPWIRFQEQFLNDLMSG